MPPFRFSSVLILASLTLIAVPVRSMALPVDAEPDCSRKEGTLPDPSRPAGRARADIPVDHVLVIMDENHSFDTFLGRLNRPGHYAPGEIDGIDDAFTNPDAQGKEYHPYHQPYVCVRGPDNSWEASVTSWDEGRNDGFVLTNDDAKKKDGHRVISYYDEKELPFLYGLADQFTVADRFFSSFMGPTYPNRFFLMTGTSFGWTRNKIPKIGSEYAQPTIFETLDRYGISWKYYYSDLSALMLFTPYFLKHLGNSQPVSRYYSDLKKGTLPQVAFLESSLLFGAEHPPFNFQLSQHEVEKRIKALIASPYWNKSALFLTYDEHGGFFDHVSPPRACKPDDIDPLDAWPAGIPAGESPFERYGFRVPFVAISPYVKRHHVSHADYDFTSILKYIETKFNLPALTRRDANADGLTEMFDYAKPDFSRPELPKQPVSLKQQVACLFKKSARYPEQLELREHFRKLKKLIRQQRRQP